MAVRRKTRKRTAQIGFEAISIEGGLLSPEWLSKVAQLEAGMQSEADYDIPKGLNIRDEIGRYWRIAQAHWKDFDAGLTAGVKTQELADRFVGALLPQVLGFKSLVGSQVVTLADRSYPIGHAALTDRVPVVIAPAASGLDALSAAFGDGGRRRSAFGLAQEYLNAQDGALWGIATDGAKLRILRDNASLTRPAWIEVDLQRMFTEERYADFAAFWLLCHESRFGRDGAPTTDCPLEAWREAGREEGTRAREHLRAGVEEALLALGQGFLAHPDNQALRASLHDGTLPAKDYFNQLLRLVYRLIFLLTVEERGLLHPDGTLDAARQLYSNGYAVRRLRERSVKRSAHDRFGDLWEGTKIAFRGLANGEPRLGLPALAGIFARTQCPTLDAAKLENRALLRAIFRLAWLREDGSLARVNWRDMGPEELGSVYESLLELVPQVTEAGRTFAFASGAETKGNARKTTGSYYTPDSLVQVLLDSALEPVIADTITRNPEKPVEALLSLSIVDPACGSGHFLLAAAERLAAHVARMQANGTPTVPEYRHALRQVVSRCIYGVDLNPMAVELCKVSLWMKAVEPGLPLTFLDSHIQHGNALLGTTPELMEKGIPDAAWEPIEGDDKKVASALKKRNKAEAKSSQMVLEMSAGASEAEAMAVSRVVADLEAASDADAEALARKESQWEGLLGSHEYRHQKLVADAWCAAFVWPKQPGALAEAAPTNEMWRVIRDARGAWPALATQTVNELAEQYRFFHWHLQFPQVFAKGGFDVALGNPPWEQTQLEEREWFANRLPDVANASTGAERKRLIGLLRETDPLLHAAFTRDVRVAAGYGHLLASSGRYPLCGRGRMNVYAVFAEHYRCILSAHGRAGFVVPTGIATDDSTKFFFQDVVRSKALVSLFDFENRRPLFSDVHRSFKFCLVTVGSGRVALAARAKFVFFAVSIEDLRDSTRSFMLSSSDIELLNPNTRTCPVFRRRRDAELTLEIHRRLPALLRESRGDDVNANPWGIRLKQGLFNMTSDSARFHAREALEGDGFTPSGGSMISRDTRYLPLYEAKMIHQFDHRWATYEGSHTRDMTPVEKEDATLFVSSRYWVLDADVAAALDSTRWSSGWFLGWRDITNGTNERTVISSLVPRVAIGNKLPLVLFEAHGPQLAPGLLAVLNSFVHDYTARQKMSGTTLNFYLLQQFPVPAPQALQVTPNCQHPAQPITDFLLPRVLELSYTAWDLEPFARDVGYDGPPFRWDPARRFLLRCELDAAFFHLYGLNRQDTDYVMDTFPIVRKNDEKVHGEYRTKRVILEIYDEMAEASRTGTPYQTRLDPPPADPRVAHPDTRPRLGRDDAAPSGGAS